MEKIYKRNPLLPSIMVACVLIFFINFFLQLLNKNIPLALFTLLTLVFILINVIWLFSNPLVIVNEQEIDIKEGLFKQKKIKINQIEKTDLSSDKYANIFLKDKSNYKLRYNSFSKSDIEDFIVQLKSLKLAC